MGGGLPASRRTEPLALACGKGPSRQGGSSPISGPKAKVQGSSGPDAARAPVHLGAACPAAPLTARQLPDREGRQAGAQLCHGECGSPGGPEMPPAPVSVGKTTVSWHGGRWAGRSLRHWPWWSPEGPQGAGHKGETRRGTAGLDTGVQALAVAGRALPRRWLFPRCRRSGRCPLLVTSSLGTAVQARGAVGVIGSGSLAGTWMVEMRVLGAVGPKSVLVTSTSATPLVGRWTEIPATRVRRPGQVWEKGPGRGVHAPRFQLCGRGSAQEQGCVGPAKPPTWGHLTSQRVMNCPAHSALGLSMGSLPPQA